jgi:arylsulfatase A-like enzyme
MDKHDYPNIILIVIDALRARNLGCYGGKREASPQIDKIASEGILFENAFSTWNTTDQSLTTILSGRYPRTHGIIHHGDKVKTEDRQTFEKLNIRLLPEILRPLGYKTIAIDWMGRWFKKGFDYYGYKTEQPLFKKIRYALFSIPYIHLKYMISHIGLLKIYLKKRKKGKSYRASLWKSIKDVLSTFFFTFELARLQDANIVTDIAEEWARKLGKEKYFLFLHYWDTHTPYNCPKQLSTKKKDVSSVKEKLSAKYAGAVSYVDQNIGRLLKVIGKESQKRDTLLIITSDHGESLTEHDIFFDHHGLYDVTTQVPLIMYYPKSFSNPGRIKSLVQHVDLLPSLLDLLQIDSVPYRPDGKSLLPLIGDEKQEIRSFCFQEESYVQRKIALRTHKFKYIYAPDGYGLCKYCQMVHGGAEELYNLEKDPEERTNIVDKDTIIAQQMHKILDEFYNKLESKRRKEIEEDPSDDLFPNERPDPKEEKEIKRKLRGLGYMD